MNTDEIIEIAIQGHASTRDVIRWAIQQEREACAKVCYDLMCKENPYDRWEGMKWCMDAIRARGRE